MTAPAVSSSVGVKSGSPPAPGSPASLTNPILQVVGNDAVNSSGNVLSITSQTTDATVYTRSQTAAYIYNTTKKPTHVVCERDTTTNTHDLRNTAVSGLLAPLNGNVDISLWFYVNYVDPTIIPIGGMSLFQAAGSVNGYTILAGSATITSGISLRIGDGAANNSTYNVAFTRPTGTFNLYGLTYSASANTMKAYLDGVLQGTSPVQTARTPSSLAQVYLSQFNNGTFGAAYYGMWACNQYAANATEHAAVNTWITGLYA